MARTRQDLAVRLAVALALAVLIVWLIPGNIPASSAFKLVGLSEDQTVQGEEAFVSVLSGVQYLAGCLALGYSLDTNGSPDRKRKKVLLVPHQAIDEPVHLEMLAKVGWEVKQVKELALPAGSVDWHFVDMLAKLYAWNLDFSQVAIIDSDALVIGPLTEAFSLLRLSSSSTRLAAALAPTKPIPTEFVTDKFAGHFNAGVLFIKPSQEHYDALVKHSQDKNYYRLELAEQNLLNEYYGGRFLGLPSTYNLISLYMPRIEYWDLLRPDAKVLHFAGPTKPWHMDAEPHESITLWRETFKTMVKKYSFTKHDFITGSHATGIPGFDFDALMNSGE